MAVSPKCSGYSRNGEYFAFCGADGKLKIWDTESSILKQEFTPNFHLVSPCSCLLWINFSRNPAQHRKKRAKSLSSEATYVALGTSAGEVYLYNHATASIETQLRGGHSQANVNDLTWAPGSNLYSCANDGVIVEWSLSDFKVKSKWKAGTEKVLSILVSPDGKWLFSGARAIHWWDAESHELLHSFTGHTSPLLSLTFIPQVSSNGNTYLISTAAGDRYMNIWTLKKKAGKNAAVSLVLNNDPTGHVIIRTCMEGPSIVGSVTQSGDLEIFKHELNGMCPKPLKAALQLQVASDSEADVHSIPILAACYLPDLRLKIAYGNTAFLSFDSVAASTAEKLQVIVRRDPRQPLKTTKKEALTKVRETKTDTSVEYHVNAASAASASSVKRKLGGTRSMEAAMEERLENLSIGLAKAEEKDPVPRAYRTSHLLAQALAGNDSNMLNTALSNRDEGVITKTVERLTIQNVADLLKALVSLVQGKTASSLIATRWLKVVLTVHASYLMSNPDLIDMVAPLVEIVQSRLSLLPMLGNLKGRLDMLNAQLSTSTESATGTAALQPGLLVYQDVDTSEDEGDCRLDFGGGSESDDKWEELSDTEDEDGVENENDGEEDDDDDDDDDDYDDDDDNDDDDDDGGGGDMDVDESN